ncbi:hypothetical protein AV521_36290 [Streptomyces sp. IMTB 2501]|uniref:VC0807 family protein n=1 Tax=Streptomyces sp. IMTB 2501 TaxID=1776340 RepID=UPI00096C9E8F|nr:VC0807 family protein [Streptomyces sp. IMTB 2501]OLZ64242.1 hypothetical protein AV521_36290 [Streptomyces sp. IMTB 2501]
MTASGRRQAVRRKAAGFAADFLVPVGLYYALRAAGLGLYLTLLISAVLPATVALVRLFRSRRVDGLAVYTVTMMLLSTGISLIAGSPRFMLAREAWLTGATGVWFLASAWTARPLAYLYTRPLLERRSWAGNIPYDWDDLWARLPRFRRLWRVGSALWGVALLADSALRIVMAYTLPVNAVPALGTALYIGTSLVLIVTTNVYYVASGLYDRRSRLYAPLRRGLQSARE